MARKRDAVAERIAQAEKEQRTTLDLSRMKLDRFPLEALSYRLLRRLDLSDNMIHSLPADWTTVPNLEALNISNNPNANVPDDVRFVRPLQLVANTVWAKEVPKGIFNNNWTSISLRNNHLDEVPLELRNQRELISLDVSENPIRKLPKWFRQTPIKYLFLKKIGLIEFPIDEISDYLLYLALDNNHLITTPSFAAYDRLESISMSYCDIFEFPQFLFNCPRLERLNLSNNSIRRVPRQIEDLHSLMYIDLEYNDLTDLPAEIGQLPLKRLDLRHNRLTDLPHELGKCTSLLSGAVEDPIVDGLSVSDNAFGGTLAELSDLPQPDGTQSILQFLNGTYEDGISPAETKDALLPAIPRSTAGPRFRERDETIDLEAGQGWNQEPQQERLSGLFEELSTCVEDLDAALSRSGNAHANLKRTVERYRRALEKPIEDINLDQVFALGLRLESARDAARRDISSRFDPTLEDDQEEALAATLRIHAVCMATTKEGRELMEAALAYGYKPEEDLRFKEKATPIVLGATLVPGLLTSEAKELVEEAVEGVDQGPYPQRSSFMGRGTVQGLLIVIATTVAGRLAADTFAATHLAHAITQDGAPLIDKAATFLLYNHPNIRALATVAPDSFGWLAHFLDWYDSKRLAKK